MHVQILIFSLSFLLLPTTPFFMSSPAKRQKINGSSSLDLLEQHTVIVCDTGDVDAIKKNTPQDATTNPSLIYKAALLPAYSNLVTSSISYAKSKVSNPSSSPDTILPVVLDKLAVTFGAEISKIVPGYVSTEVDARLSFDTAGTVAKARELIAMYDEVGVSKSRILIKIAATWEGVKACEVLEAEGITCNLTLIFSLAQAIACAEVGKATLISPFVGRIMDWYKKKEGVSGYESKEDPGVKSVKNIYNYYKTFGYKTIVMGASFRNSGEIMELCGCDRLTIAPSLLEELRNGDGVEGGFGQKLDASKATFEGSKIEITEAKFRWMMNEDAMATEKLAEGIRGFSADLVKLENVIREKL